MFRHWKRLVAGVVVGLFAAALTFNIDAVERLSSSQLIGTLQFFGRVLLVPGVLVSMAVSRNMHHFPLWLAALGNLAFWIAAGRFVGVLVHRLREMKKYSAWQPPVYVPEGPRMIEAAAVTGLQDECTKRWHASTGPVAAREENEWLDAVERQHRANFDLWHIEDEARAPGALDAEVARVKRRVDETNQRRNDLTEELDRILVTWLENRGLPRATAPLNSESPGLIVDRLSILALKIYHTREEAGREDAPAGHAERNRERLAILEEQRSDLAGCLDALWYETLAGTRRFKMYRQLKMYNDPSLNPAIYGKVSQIRGG
ncbi:MAG TPA: DUF4254 domain-containing protein [Terracidiphilus sp.]|nr:DUF4254 domain-containing protein [Terracidiphilus sp.]